MNRNIDRNTKTETFQTGHLIHIKLEHYYWSNVHTPIDIDTVLGKKVHTHIHRMRTRRPQKSDSKQKNEKAIIINLDAKNMRRKKTNY